jgi:cell division protein FtsQ
MWRKVLNITSWVLLTAYLGASLWLTGQRMKQLTFHQVVVTITDSLESHFISPAEVTEVLSQKGIRTTGSRLEELNRDQVKNTVKTLSGVKEATVYSTPDGILFIEVSQRTPVMRYISPFTSYYIDTEGREMALSDRYSARVLMVTGAGDKKFLKDSLFGMVNAIRSEAFLDALVQEISIFPDHTLEIIPRVGDHRIFFGDAGNYDWKLTKLKVFYEKGLPNVGWDRYSQIDLRYSNQVVARKWNDAERQLRDSARMIRDTTAPVKPVVKAKAPAPAKKKAWTKKTAPGKKTKKKV